MLHDILCHIDLLATSSHHDPVRSRLGHILPGVKYLHVHTSGRAEAGVRHSGGRMLSPGLYRIQYGADGDARHNDWRTVPGTHTWAHSWRRVCLHECGAVHIRQGFSSAASVSQDERRLSCLCRLQLSADDIYGPVPAGDKGSQPGAHRGLFQWRQLAVVPTGSRLQDGNADAIGAAEGGGDQSVEKR